MSDLDKISMMLITYAGTARSKSIEMIDAADKGENVETYISEIEENIRLAQNEHFKILTMSAEEEVKPTVLFLHAEDQMMNAETLFIMAKKLAKVHKKVNEK